LLIHPGSEAPDIDHPVFGITNTDLRGWIADADMLWNFSYALRPPLLNRFRWRVLMDVDPGLLQVSALDWDLGFANHDRHLTSGMNMGNPGCEVPTLGFSWLPFIQALHLDFWPEAPDPGRAAPFTSITHWNWGELCWNGRRLSCSKREAYLQAVSLPRTAARRFLIAANLRDPDDTLGDHKLLKSGGWEFSDPWVVADTPTNYRTFIQQSRAEISFPKPIYVDLRTGWFSDRSAAYLASGRPVVMQNTYLPDYFQTGEGLLTFSTLSEAAECIQRVDKDYSLHSKAARRFAEDVLDAKKTLPRTITACG
jgi:hypothetical protein